MRYFLLLLITLFFVGCKDSLPLRESSLHNITEGCAFSVHGYDLLHVRLNGKWDSLMAACDTVFVVDTIPVYDTLYSDTVFERYTSFVFGQRDKGALDTITALTEDSLFSGRKCGESVYCRLDSLEKTFSCVQSSHECPIVRYKKRLPMMVVDINSNGAKCDKRNKVLCIRDSILVDSLIRGTVSKKVTTYLNYGKKAWTDYVPWINAPLFDKDRFRAALDTLDLRHPTFGMDTLESGYFIYWEGLPQWVKRGSIDSKVKAVHYVYASSKKRFPTDYVKEPFFFVNGLEKPLEKDTLVTWTLKYHYLDGNFEGNSDSLSIVTLFKSGK